MKHDSDGFTLVYFILIRHSVFLFGIHQHFWALSHASVVPLGSRVLHPIILWPSRGSGFTPSWLKCSQLCSYMWPKVKTTKSLFRPKMDRWSFTKQIRPFRPQSDNLSPHSEHLKSAKSRIWKNQNCKKNELKLYNTHLSSLFLPHKKCPCVKWNASMTISSMREERAGFGAAISWGKQFLNRK